MADRLHSFDGDERSFSYNALIRASFALGSALKSGTRNGECIGVMLPTSAAAALTFFGLSAFGRVPTMLNFTSGLAGLKSALKTAQVRRIVTARRLVDMANLQTVIAGLDDIEIVYLEDVRKTFHCATSLRQYSANWRRAGLRQRPIPQSPP